MHTHYCANHRCLTHHHIPGKTQSARQPERVFSNKALIATALAISLLAGCATAPPSPRVAVMPAPGKSFDQFAADERECRGYAQQSVGTNPNTASSNDVVGGAVAGTAIGAGVGALAGGRHGAGVGAIMGLFTGTAIGASQGQANSNDLQRRYDIAYEQCMYAKGNQLPEYNRPRHVYQPANPPPAYYPPPPPPPAYPG